MSCTVLRLPASLCESMITAEAVPWLRTWGISACGIRPLAVHGSVDLQVGPPRFSVLLAGTCQTLDASHPGELHAGDGFLTVTGAAHALMATSEAWVLWVTWTEAPRSPRTRIAVAGWQALLAAFNGIQEAYLRGEDGILPVWTALFGRTLRKALTPMDVRLHRMMAAIAREPHAPWQLDQLADLVGLGPEQLRRLCQEHIGVSPMEWVTHQRLYRAAILLTTACSLAEIAGLVGYGNQFNFSTAFKRIFGLSPAHWRQRLVANTATNAKAGSGRWRRLG